VLTVPAPKRGKADAPSRAPADVLWRAPQTGPGEASDALIDELAASLAALAGATGTRP
jgi:hypothetical protein